MADDPAHYQAGPSAAAEAEAAMPTLMDILTDENLAPIAAALPPGMPLVVVSVASPEEARIVLDYMNAHGRAATLIEQAPGSARQSMPLAITQALPPGAPAGAIAIWVDRAVPLVRQ